MCDEEKEANDIFEAAKADPEKRRKIQEREDALRNYNHAIYVATEYAKAEGLAEGRAEGLAEGRAEGELIGFEKGQAEERAKAYAEKISTIKNLLQIGLSAEQIAAATGVSITEIESITHPLNIA